MENTRKIIAKVIKIYKSHGAIYLIRKILKVAYYQLYYHRIREMLWHMISKILHIYPPAINSYKPLNKVLNKLMPCSYTAADPLKIIWIAPSEIEYVSNIHYTEPLGQVKKVEKAQKFEQLPAYKGLEEYFHKGNPNRYKEFFEKRTKDGKNWGLKHDQFEERLEELEKLYENIQKEGYKTQKELINKNKRKTIAKNNDAAHPLLNEIKVDVNRNGEFLWRTRGKHRLILAKIIEIDKVPVLIGARDPEWERILKKSMETQKVENIYAEHPDIRKKTAKEEII